MAEPCVGAIHASTGKGVDAAISARIADECSRGFGQTLTEEEKLYGCLAGAAKERALNTGEKSKIIQPVNGRAPSGSPADLEHVGCLLGAHLEHG